MENLILSLDVVTPLFLLMALGFFLRKTNVLEEDYVEKGNKVLFRVFLSTLVFYSLYNSDIREIFDVRLLIFAAAGVILYFLALVLICPRFIKDKNVSDTIIQGAYRGNCLIFGIPIATSLFGSGGVGPTALIAAVMIPLFNIFSVMIFSRHDASWKEQLKKIITNPLIIAVILGLVFVIFEIKLPSPLESAVGSLAQIGSPLSLIILGASFQFTMPKSKVAPLISCLLLKLVVEPAIFLTIGYFVFGFTGTYFVALLAAFATPASSTSFIVASAMGGDSRLSAQIVVFTSLASILSIFIIVYCAIYLGIL